MKSTAVFDDDVRKMPHSLRRLSMPTRERVALRLCEWADLCTLIPTVTEGNSKLGTAVPCYMEQDHQDQLKWLNCKSATPLDQVRYFWMNWWDKVKRRQQQQQPTN